MRCRACDTVWLVSGPSSASSVAQADDMDNTAPRAAVQRRGAERERRDLFASRPVEEGAVRETMRPPPSFAPPSSNGFAPPSSMGASGVAARNENSVLFKVTDILGPAGTARVKTPEPSVAPSSMAAGTQSRNGKEDSGIIDLKALSSAPPRPNRAPAPMLFGASEPPPAFARDVSASSASYPQAGSPAKSKLRAFGMIAAGFAVVAMCGVGVALAFGGSNPPPKAAAAIVVPPPPAPPPAVTAPPAPEPASTSAASASNDEPKESKKSSGKQGKRGGKSSGASTSSGLITSKSPPPPPPPKVKAADPCGCHGDFNCILACTAGKK